MSFTVCVSTQQGVCMGEIDGLGSLIKPLHPRKHFTKHTCKPLADAL